MTPDEAASRNAHPAGRALKPCGHRGCPAPGHDVYDHYGIFAGRFCDDHEAEAPGQWAYAGADTEPLEED